MQSKVNINNSWYSKSLEYVSVMFFVFCTKNELKKVESDKINKPTSNPIIIIKTSAFL